MRTSPPPLMRRAIVAVLLTIGFYGLALAVVALLLFIIFAQFRFLPRGSEQLTGACLVSAGLILWNILPRPQRFKAPGPRLEPAQNPDLFREVNDLANQVGQKPPDDVYVVPGMNAFVAEHGGLIGIGRRRIMGIGLPLLQVLTVPQFRAVVAHEFGHFYGGDTRLAPWIYRTRQTIVRTIQGAGVSAWARLIFRWYGLLFLRTTQDISRRQESVADELAAHIAGSLPLVEGLRAIRAAAPAFDGFWRNEMAPVLQSGYRPPLSEGFALFLRQPWVADTMRKSVAQDMEVSKTDPYDSHPSLRERIAAVQALPPGLQAEDQTPAISLVQNVPEIEQGVLVQVLGKEQTACLQPVDWPSAATKVWLVYWSHTVCRHAAGLRGVTAASLPQLLRSPGPLGLLAEQEVGRLLSNDEKGKRVADVAAQALAVALAHQGWTLDVSPGATVSLQRGATRFEPFVDVWKLASGELSAEAWQARCAEAGIADLHLDGAV